MKREMTCIVCPKGCKLEVFLKNGKVKDVSGNLCKRGITYAIAEIEAPERIITSTVRSNKDRMVPVRTSGTVPKAYIFDIMKELKKVRIGNNIKMGDIIVEDILGTGVDVIASCDM